MPIHVFDDFRMMCEKLLDVLTESERLWNEGLDTLGKGISKATERNHEKILDTGLIMKTPYLKKINKTSLDHIKGLVKRPPKPPSPLAQGDMSPVYHLDPTAPFILPPLDRDKEFIPLLSATYEFGLTTYRLSFPVAMIRYHNDSFDFWGVGFRFESSWNGGNHDYFHVQPTPQPFKTGRFARKLPVFCNWLPSTYPCVPSGAFCPVTLLYTLLVSMYGRTGFTNAFLSDWAEPKYRRVLKQWWT